MTVLFQLRHGASAWPGRPASAATVGGMRRHSLLAAIATGSIGVLFLAGCASSDDAARRTVTAVVTVSSSPGTDAAATDTAASGDASAAETATGATDTAAASGSETAATSASDTASPSPEPFVTVDPLAADCGALLNAADVKRVFNVDIATDRVKIRVAEVNADVGQVGRVRCLYGLNAEKTSGDVTVAFTTYTDPAAATDQAAVTIQTESDAGASIVQTTVRGYPASMALREGGLLVMAYDNWTMALATRDGAFDQAALEAGLPQLADTILARVLKT